VSGFDCLVAEVFCILLSGHAVVSPLSCPLIGSYAQFLRMAGLEGKRRLTHTGCFGLLSLSFGCPPLCARMVKATPLPEAPAYSEFFRAAPTLLFHSAGSRDVSHRAEMCLSLRVRRPP